MKGNIITKVEDIVLERSPLKHPFYVAWSEGRLTIDALRGYALEYFHLVKNVPIMVQNILERYKGTSHAPSIEKNLQEEKEHVELWMRFCESLGIGNEELANYEVSEKTREAVDMMVRGTQSPYGPAIMYAYEWELPKISNTKLEGLKKFYNMDSEDATIYHRIHSVVDVEHAHTWRSIIEEMPREDKETILSYAKMSMDAQNKVLDAVYERYGDKILNGCIGGTK